MKFHPTISLALLLGGPILMALTAPVLADPRTDVLLASQRCSAITDDHAWLDCYYGSAQPMRAQLGLPPAPASQLRLVPPAFGGSAPQAFAPQAFAPQPAPAYGVPAAPVYGGPAYGIPAAPPAYGVQGQAVASAGPPPMERRRATGFMGGLFGSSKPVLANVHMAAYAMNRDGKFSVTLANGEVWDQDGGDEAIASWRKPAERYVVNIYDGALGSYNMEVADDSQLYKVHRVK